MRAARGYEPGKNWDQPMYNVFRKDADGMVRHFWGSELLYVQEEPGQNHRAGDLVDPVWGLLDMSPEGRGDFFPKLELRLMKRGSAVTGRTWHGMGDSHFQAVRSANSHRRA